MGSSLPPYPDSAFTYLAQQESTHWWFLARNDLIIWAFLTKICKFERYLDVGCGTGFVLSAVAKQFPDCALDAVEYYSTAVKIAKYRVPRCNFKQLDAATPLSIESYDCISCFDVLEHINNDDSVIFNIYRALKSQGYFIATVPQHKWLWSDADYAANHCRRYTHSELTTKIVKSGFKVIYSTSFVSLLLPLMALQRLLPRSRYYHPDEEFKISPFLNAALYKVMQLEITLLRLGLRFPVGGSLLLLARKQ